MAKIQTQTAAAEQPNEEKPANLPVGYQDSNSSLAVSLARAEVDQQIMTARAMPRSIQRAVDNIMTLATLDVETAEECVYALPRAGKAIKGPSIRLAEIIASQWGNARVGARVVHVDRFEKFVEAEGVFHDLETNVATTSRVRRRISDKSGRLLTDDMIVVTGNAACSIAKRNAILGAVPKGVWRRAYASVESVIAGDVKTLAERRDRAMKAFAAFGVKPERVFEVLAIKGLDDITLEHMTVLTGMHSALKSGESTVEEMFSKRETATGPKPSTEQALDQLAKKDNGTGTPSEQEGQAGGGASKPGTAEDGGAKSSAGPSTAASAGAAEPEKPRFAIDIDADAYGIDNQAAMNSDSGRAAFVAGVLAAWDGVARPRVPAKFKPETHTWQVGHDYGSKLASEKQT